MSKLVAFLATCAVTAHAYAAAPATPVAVIPLETYQGKQLVMRATVAGRARTFLFDTGEGITMISPALAADTRCAPWGNITAFRMLGERLDLARCDDMAFSIGRHRYRAPTVIVYDLAEIAGKDAPPLDGAIGLDLFSGRTITIEFQARRLVVESPGSLAARIAHASKVTVRLVRDSEGASLTVALGVPTSRGLAWMELDTGNSGPTIFVAPGIAPLLGIDADMRTPQPVQATLAPHVILTQQARVFPKMIIDGNIGMQFLKDWNLTLDLQNGAAWLAPAIPRPQ